MARHTACAMAVSLNFFLSFCEGEFTVLLALPQDVKHSVRLVSA